MKMNVRRHMEVILQSTEQKKYLWIKVRELQN